MAEIINHGVKYEHCFDAKRKRHFVNGTLSVFHCHHYLTLYTQLAIDAGRTEMLKESARASFKPMLTRYFERHCTASELETRVKTVQQYYGMLGLGKMEVLFIGEESGDVELLVSHADAGWMKKWGPYDRPINYVSAGYIEAMFEVVLNTSDKAFVAKEIESIVMGAERSRFRVVRR